MEKKANAFFFLSKKKKRKILLIMRLVIVLLILGMNQISANVFSQKNLVSFRFENISFEQLLWEIQKQTDFVFMYGEDDIKGIQNISIEADNSEVINIIQECIKDTDIEMELVDEVVVIMKKKELPSQEERIIVKVKGKVTDENGDSSSPGQRLLLKVLSKAPLLMPKANTPLKCLVEGAYWYFLLWV